MSLLKTYLQRIDEGDRIHQDIKDRNPNIKTAPFIGKSKIKKVKKGQCPECYGRGKVIDQDISDDDHARYKKCPVCNGTGKMKGNPGDE